MKYMISHGYWLCGDPLVIKKKSGDYAMNYSIMLFIKKTWMKKLINI